MEAMNQATTALGDEDISQGLSAAQVLADSNARQMASRWRSGSESRSTWVNWKNLGSLLLLVLFPRLLAFLIVMSVRVLARIALMLSSRLIRELVSQVAFMAADLEANIIDWLYQAWMETPSAMEALQSAPSSSSCAAPTWTPPSALTGPAAPTSLPTRPVDFLTLFLLLVQTLRSLPRGWGGWVRPQLG